MQALKFEGQGFEYFKIWIVNILLTVITLGLYYPWAKVRTNRYFYGNTLLNARNFEYHATGKQLFIAHLIALSLFILYNILGSAMPIAALIMLLLFFIAIPWIIWRSMIFRMRMTSFSNVRFGFTGTLKEAYIIYLGLPLLLMLIYGIGIGLAIGVGKVLSGVAAGILILIIVLAVLATLLYVYAHIHKRSYSYLVNNSKYGQGLFSADLETGEFFKILLKTTALWLVPILVIIGIAVFRMGLDQLSMMFQLLKMQMNAPRLLPVNMAMDQTVAGLIGVAAYIGFILLIVIVGAYATARYRKYVYGQTLLDGKIRMESTVGARSLAWILVSNILLLIFTLALAYPWTKIRHTRFLVENTLVDTSVGFDEYISEKVEQQSSLGEQIGDAFDIDVAVGF